jgi:hypothetical protein
MPPSNDSTPTGSEEALTHGPDSLHLAVVFGVDRKTAIRYADSARQLRQTPIEDHTPEPEPTQASNPMTE